jgi:hypothetical protein
MKRVLCILGFLLAANRMSAQTYAGPYPQKEISNGLLRARIYLPDAEKGFYRGTRFDWSGVIASLEYKGHSYFGPFFEKFDPSVADVVIGNPVIAGINSAASGPVEEFIGPGETGLGYSDAKPGQAFCKIGVGSLRRIDDAPYSSYTNYPILNGGKRTFNSGSDFIEFTQQVDCGSGYGYTYMKKISLLKGRPVMTIEHRLLNTGAKVITTQVYDHNFLSIDHEQTGPAIVVTFPFALAVSGKVDGPGLSEVQGNQLLFPKELKRSDTFYSEFTGYGKTASDYQLRVENRKTGAGVAISADRPLVNLGVWAVRTVVAPEPYIDINIPPGHDFSWKYRYRFYQPGPSKSSTQ